ncbi:MAG TPA: menaquinone biosynthesis protein [Candidatus Sulfotelmatobacter sp.]
MRKLRISAISYLNTAPLMWDFEHGDAGSHFEISYTIPSACARALADGSADIGIIPAAAYTQIPRLQILPDVAIASRQAVRSILLVSKVPVEKIRSVALDESSMTSVALAKLLLQWLGLNPQYDSMQPDIEKMLSAHDAGLLIGDPALQVDRTRYCTLDLAEEWIRVTGKPFVFAFWAVRGEALKQSDPMIDLPAIFRNSRDHGLEPANLGKIVDEWSATLNLSAEEVQSYLTQNIHYRLDPPCVAGLQLFYRHASEIGALPVAPELHFLESASTPAT